MPSMDSVTTSHNPSYTKLQIKRAEYACDTFPDFLVYVFEAAQLKVPFFGSDSTSKCKEYGYIRSFLQTARKSVKNSANNEVEDLLNKSFGYLRVFKDRSFENTCCGVKNFNETIMVNNIKEFGNDVEGQRFLDMAAKEAVMVIRAANEHDHDLKDVHQSTINRPCRLAPWSVYGIVHFVGKSEKLMNHIEFCSQYVNKLVTISPGRRVAFCALTNFVEIVFAAAYFVIENNVEVMKLAHSSNINKEGKSKVWIKQMALFLSMEAELLGFVDTIYSEYGALMQSALGRGSTAAAVVLYPPVNNMSVLKVSRDVDGLANEIRVVAAIRAHIAVAAANPAVAAGLLSRMPNCIAEGNHPFLSLLDRRFSKVESVTPAVVLSVWELLQCIHAAGFVHRDLRKANLIKVGNEYGLIDFSSSHHPDGVAFGAVLHIPPGTLATASCGVVGNFFRTQTGDYQCRLNDEVISLIYLMIHHFPPLADSFYGWYPRSQALADAKMNWALTKLDLYLPLNDRGKLVSLIQKLEKRSDQALANSRDKILRECVRILQGASHNLVYQTVPGVESEDEEDSDAERKTKRQRK